MIGRFVSQDPIGLIGGFNTFVYAPNAVVNTDPFGLCSTKLDKALGGVTGDGMQAHHLVPEEIWAKHEDFFNRIGLGGKRDTKENGLLMPGSKAKAKRMRRKFYHCGSHAVYSVTVDQAVNTIEKEFKDGVITAEQANARIGSLQQTLRATLSVPGRSPVRVF